MIVAQILVDQVERKEADEMGTGAMRVVS